jgi:5-methyltetrahydropteroyltriglutamate--homocysteine methyltransferase
MLLPTSLVGSYPQPDWLIDRERLSKEVPRIRADNLWRVAPEKLEAAQDHATILAIREQERAGLSIITDGEQRRESYSNRFATALDGIDSDHPGTTLSRIGKPIAVPRVVGPIRRTRAVLVRDLAVLRANTERPVKMTLPGPFTMSKQAQDEFYGDGEAMAFDFAAAVNAEIRDLFAAGADIVQLDEPWMQQHPDDARRYGLAALNRALDGVTGTVAVHLCFGYAALVHEKPAGYSFLPELENCKAAQISIEAAQPRLNLAILKALPSKTIVLGVNDLADENAETPELVADRIRAALAYVPAERLAVAPDCGMKYLPRAVAFAKMKALAEGAATVRREIGGG